MIQEKNEIKKIVNSEIKQLESSSDNGWINWFCTKIEGHEFFVEVEIEYIKDTFNLYGLKERIPRFNEALKMILSSDSPDSEDLND